MSRDTIIHEYNLKQYNHVNKQLIAVCHILDFKSKVMMNDKWANSYLFRKCFHSITLLHSWHMILESAPVHMEFFQYLHLLQLIYLVHCGQLLAGIRNRLLRFVDLKIIWMNIIHHRNNTINLCWYVPHCLRYLKRRFYLVIILIYMNWISCYDIIHCVKFFRIGSFFWTIFSHIWTIYGD